MSIDFTHRCDCCGRPGALTHVKTAIFDGNFCSVCSSLIMQTTRPDGTSRLHPTHLKQIMDKIKLNQSTANLADLRK